MEPPKMQHRQRRLVPDGVVTSSAGSRPSRATFAYVSNDVKTGERGGAGGGAGGGSVVIDDSDEWAKIENIMASLDAGLSDCDVVNGANVTVTPPTALPVSRLQPNAAVSPDLSGVPPIGQWLTSCRLSHLEDVLLSNGFDDVDFIGPGFLADSDLVEMGVASPDDRRRLLAAASRLPSHATRTPCQFESISSWLKCLRLSEYLETFQSHGCSSLGRLQNLWDVELTSVLRIGRLGHRNRILAAISNLPTLPVPVTGVKGQLEEDGWSTSKSAKQSLNELSLYKDYTSLLHKRSRTSHSLTPAVATTAPTSHPPSGSEEPPVQQRQVQQPQRQPQPQSNSVTSNSVTSQSQKPPPAGSLQIRPPAHSSADCDIKQWSHKPEVLLHGGCTYNALFVGTGAVDQLDDPDATRHAIANIRQRSVSLPGGVTSVTLTISHTGIAFHHAQTKELMGSHDIGNIFCACQDAKLLDYFAYVTWQPSVGQHHCHVFCAENVQLAMEVVLTLGQAFEVAYQLAVLNNPAVQTQNSTTPSTQRPITPTSSLRDRVVFPYSGVTSAQKPVTTVRSVSCTRAGLPDGRTGFVDGRTGFIDSRTGLADGRTGYADGKGGLVDGKTGLADGTKDGRINGGSIIDSKSGSTGLQDGRSMLPNARNGAPDGKSGLPDARTGMVSNSRGVPLHIY